MLFVTFVGLNHNTDMANAFYLENAFDI